MTILPRLGKLPLALTACAALALTAPAPAAWAQAAPSQATSSAAASPSDVARRLLAAFESRDVAGVLALCADNAVMAMPFATEGPTQLQGKPQLAGYFGAVFQRYRAIRFGAVQLTPAADGKTVFLETDAEYEAADGSKHRMGYVWAMEVAQGQVVGSRTYTMAAPPKAPLAAGSPK